MTWMDFLMLLIAMLGLGLGSANIYRASVLLTSSKGETGRWLIGWGMFQIVVSIYFVAHVAGIV